MAVRIAPIALANLLVPLSFALPAAIPLYATHAGGSTTLPGFAFFFGLALSITALPVLARILKDMGMFATPIGTLALASAAVCDLLIVRLERAGVSESMFLPLVLVAAILSAVATEVIGIHAALGALLFGAVLPRRTALLGGLVTRIEGVTVAVLLPVFFAYVGLRTSLGSLGTSVNAWLIWVGILVLAMGTKILGVSTVAKANGLAGTDAVSLGILLNCRGLTEMRNGNGLRKRSPCLP